MPAADQPARPEDVRVEQGLVRLVVLRILEGAVSIARSSHRESSAAGGRSSGCRRGQGIPERASAAADRALASDVPLLAAALAGIQLHHHARHQQRAERAVELARQRRATKSRGCTGGRGG